MDNMNTRLRIWSLLLQPYNFEVIHKPGREMRHADDLSRKTEQGQAQDQHHNQDKEEPDYNLREEEGGRCQGKLSLTDDFSIM